MRVFLDLDGVLVDFVGGMCECHGRNNPYDPVSDPPDISMEKLWGMTFDDFWKPARDPLFWEHLSWTDDGRDILDNVLDEVGKENVVILSSASSPPAAAGKIAWIKRNIPEIGNRFLIGNPKDAVASPYHILIDDWDVNIDAFQARDGLGVLVPRPWNSLFRLYPYKQQHVIVTQSLRNAIEQMRD